MKDKSDKTIRILLADASRLTTLGITQVLEKEADMEIVGVATDGEDAVAKAGELEPDIGIFAFAIEATVARGEGSDAGWFFVLKERPGQPRFGADDSAAGVLEDWNSLSYQHLAFPSSTPELLRIQGNTGPNLIPTSTDATRPIAARWGKSAADMAYALMQAPVLYARHAAEMLPTPPAA